MMTDADAVTELLAIQNIMIQRHAGAVLMVGLYPNNDTFEFQESYYQRKREAVDIAMRRLLGVPEKTDAP